MVRLRRGGRPGRAGADDGRPRPPDPPRPRPRRRTALGSASRPDRRPRLRRRCRRATPSTVPRPRCAPPSSTRRWSLRGAPPRRRRPPCRAHDRAGREPRQAPRDGVGRRRHPAHAHADERLVAPLPDRARAGSATTARCGRWSRSRAGWPCASAPRSSRRTGGRMPAATPVSAGSGPTCAATTPTCGAASTPCSPTRTPRPRSPSSSSTSGCSAASATCTGARSCGSAS